MGGRGGSIRGNNGPTQSTQQPVSQAAAQPDQANTPSGYTFDDLQNMNDQELHDFLIDAYDTDLPDFLNTRKHLQRMVYSLGMNDKPEISITSRGRATLSR